MRNIIKKRVNPDGGRCSDISEGSRSARAGVPREKDQAHEEKLIDESAKLEFRLLPKDLNVTMNQDDNGIITGVTMTDRGSTLTDQQVIDRSYLVMTGSQLRPNSGVTYDNAHKPAVSFSIDKEDVRQGFGAFTEAHKGEYLAIVLDNKIMEAPVIKDAIPGDGIIAGGFPTLQSAQDLATLLNAGALPVPVRIVESRMVGPGK